MTTAKQKARDTIAAINKILEPQFDFDATTGEIWLDGEIDSGEISASGVRQALKAMKPKQDLTIYLNSPGGSVTEGMAIYRVLEKHRGKITTHVSTLAASMASVILQIGSERVCDKSGLVMVHSPWVGRGGNALELRKSADLLEKIERELLGIYVARTGRTSEDVQKMLEQETWMNAAEAVQAGFVDRIADSSRAAAAWEVEAAKKAVAIADRKRNRKLTGLFPKREAAKKKLAWVNAWLEVNSRPVWRQSW